MTSVKLTVNGNVFIRAIEGDTSEVEMLCNHTSRLLRGMRVPGSAEPLTAPQRRKH